MIDASSAPLADAITDPVLDPIAKLSAIVGSEHVIVKATDQAPYLTDWRGRYTGRALAVVQPASVTEVAAVVTWCADHRVAIVPQGGNTGLVGGATPDASGQAIVLSTTRMRALRRVDAANDTITVEAGCTLAAVQQAAFDSGRLFPLSLASEGSCTIGGNLSTNAGGTGVLRYGNARELCLGIEAVLPDGSIVANLSGLRKDNTGYRWSDLLIGAEGTLGIITAATMKLFAMPRARATAWAAVASPRDAIALLGLAQARCGSTLTAFELVSDFAVSLVERHFAPLRSPFAARHPQAVLVEVSDHEDEHHARGLLEGLLADAMDRGLVRDAAIAENLAHAKSLWSLRENISEAQAAEGKNIKHDISVPISLIADFIASTDAALMAAHPGIRMVTFGHLGDGNLHYNVSPPAGMKDTDFLERQYGINRIVHDAVAAHGGSISAEHGIGQLKRDELVRYKDPHELALMRAIRRAVDPAGIMNPGKLL
jgi:FAD/FMN-containing dehydrogenase